MDVAPAVVDEAVVDDVAADMADAVDGALS